MFTPELITTRFTADGVLLGVDLSGVRAVVTGASSSLGAETARALAATRAEVTLAVRNVDAGAALADAVEPSTRCRPSVQLLDLAAPESVRAFASAWPGPLHLLVNNAGFSTAGLERTVDGRELQLATNHLAHFAVSNGLHDALAADAAGRGGARSVTRSPRWRRISYRGDHLAVTTGEVRQPNHARAAVRAVSVRTL